VDKFSADVLQRERIRALFTNTTLQNPTGTWTTREVALQLVKLAHAHDFSPSLKTISLQNYYAVAGRANRGF
jgi:hypothetical protein